MINNSSLGILRQTLFKEKVKYTVIIKVHASFRLQRLSWVWLWDCGLKLGLTHAKFWLCHQTTPPALSLEFCGFALNWPGVSRGDRHREHTWMMRLHGKEMHFWREAREKQAICLLIYTPHSDVGASAMSAQGRKGWKNQLVLYILTAGDSNSIAGHEQGMLETDGHVCVSPRCQRYFTQYSWPFTHRGPFIAILAINSQTTLTHTQRVRARKG